MIDRPSVITVLIADDHPVTRGGLALFLANEPDIEVVAQAQDGPEAVEQYRLHRPGVAMLDLQMPGWNGLEATGRLLAEFPRARILLFTTYDGDEDIYRAMKLGALGYILKEASKSEILRAVRTVGSGTRFYSAPVAEKLVDYRSAPVLTHRERQVLKMVSEGMPNKQIAFAIGLSENTVKTHVAALIVKLGVGSRTEAALAGLKRGFLRD